ncbi:MAG: hypothetical protein CMJ88_04190 [Planctomycetes bacterium]|nr:hypothetical protein [Planctomycetota bacterium]
MLVEGGVIMTSILLAFSLDALWDSRKLAGKAQVALSSLKDEFEANLRACVEVRDYHAEKARQFSAVLKMSDDDVLGMSEREATSAYYSFCSPRTFDALLGTTKSVISTGTFDILQDTQLRKELDQFLNLMEDTHEDIQNMLHFMRLLGEYEVTLGGPWGDPDDLVDVGGATLDTSYQTKITTTDLLALLRDAGFVGRVKLYHGCASWYCGELGQLAEHIRKVLRTITELQG